MYKLKLLLNDLLKMNIQPLPFIGYGNPDADILIVGKECAIEDDRKEGEVNRAATPNSSEDWKKFIEPNFNHWLSSFKGHGFRYTPGGEPYDFDSGNFHPINPFFKLENKRQTKEIKIGRPSSTYYNYQRLIDLIRVGDAKLYEKSPFVDFFNDCFITELNDICRPNNKNLRKKDHDEIRKHIQKRFDWMRKTNFFNQFKVVILACGPYANDIDEVLQKDLFGEAEVFYSNQLSFWDKTLEKDIPRIHNILKLQT